MSHFEGFRRLAPFGTAVRNRGGAEPGGPATAGRVNSYCRPALPPGNRWLARRTASLAASRDSVGARMSPWLVPGPLSRGGGPQAAMDKRLRCPQALPTKLAEKRTCTHPGARRRVFGPLSSGFWGKTGQVRRFPLCGFMPPWHVCCVKKRATRRDPLQSTLHGLRIVWCIGC